MTKDMPKTCLRALARVLLGLCLGGVAPAQAVENTEELCAEQTQRTERAENIPRHLLSAISLAESALWDPRRKENVAWPWTVTAQGEGRYFATKTDAVTHVLELWADGVSNIDVGCMQVNLYYHGGAFKTLEEAFEPTVNVAYASKYLKNMYATSGSWTQAAAYYHSTNPERYRPYKLKVLKYWNQQRRAASRSKGDIVQRNPRRPNVTIDTLRTNKLNARLRAARQQARQAGPVARRGDQIGAWRRFRGSPLGVPRLAAMRRAEKEAMRTDELLGKDKGDTAAEFAAKRREQLNDWRMDNIPTAPPPGEDAS
tara:strand:+ start:254 stop:1192 length:939 start_codon:yes stop_codon:yes gene_type:complete